ncbi:DUF2920 family protein [Haloimpatiens sp. FM7330]|uniref:DUF2920 family protein n=1 Tax=Haloimpatiens sp. FM7330 TaxID=3298610 RepID=UPI003630F0B2
MYFSEPENGINSDTGILLFIAGFGGSSNSNIYKKMREKIADEYNFVTVQCNYFGWEFMQKSQMIKNPNLDYKELKQIFTEEELLRIYNNGNLDFNKFLNIGSKYNIKLSVNEDLSGENYNNFNDMSLIQAIDNIGAVLRVMNIIYDNNYEFNASKVFIYGHSQGAYLAYLCNAFAPKLFSLIIDNSAWLFPIYLNSNRAIQYKIGDLSLIVEFDYLAKKIDYDRELIYLPKLYSKFINNCNIISYHGTTDSLITNIDKRKFCLSIEKCLYNEISNDKVDGVIFKSTNHGLDADFLELFKYTINNLEKFNIEIGKSNCFKLDDYVKIKTQKQEYLIDYTNVLPQLKTLF